MHNKVSYSFLLKRQFGVHKLPFNRSRKCGQWLFKVTMGRFHSFTSEPWKTNINSLSHKINLSFHREMPIFSNNRKIIVKIGLNIDYFANKNI